MDAVSNAIGYAALAQGSKVEPFSFERRALRPDDVAIQVLYCGVCHSDLHQIRNDWHNSVYPVVPGHEIVGRVTATGQSAAKFKSGDLVAVGCMIDSCQACEPCHEGLEQFCEKQPTMTYNSRDRQTGEPTYGGYSDNLVVSERFVLRLPTGLDPERAGPLLCAGITTWSPLRHWKVGPGSKVAVVGLGGLGHMGVKLAIGLGADVTVITTSPSKVADARELGATDVLISTDAAAMAGARNRFDLILDTIPVPHDMSAYILLAKRDGAVVIVGVIDMVPAFHSGVLLTGRRSLSASMMGGVPETQELLDFCAAKDILPECETIAMDQINHAFERMDRSDVKYRFVIDMATLK
jgi:alcohol dehydrogenase (NADP+)